MPLQKFRDGRDIPPPPAAERGSPEHLRRLRAFWSRTNRLATIHLEPGLYRYGSVEEAEQAAAAWRAHEPQRRHNS